MTSVPTLQLNNGVTMPVLGFGVFQTPPEETLEAMAAALPSATGTSTPPPPTATSARSAKASAAPASIGRRLRRDQGLDQRLRLRRDPARIRQERGQARGRADRPADPPPAAAERVRANHRGLQGARDAARRRQGARDRRQQLPARVPRVAPGAGGCRSRREPDRGPPVLPQARAASERPPRNPDPGMVADRRHHLLPRRHARSARSRTRILEIAESHEKMPRR